MTHFLAKLALFALPLIAAAALLFAAADDKRAAYHSLKQVCDDRGRFIYDRLALNPRPVDVLFVGSSKVGAGVDDRRIEAILGEDHGRPLGVLNAGYCQDGRNLHYAMLKDALRLRAIPHVVLVVSARELRVSHDAFAYLADSVDILDAPLAGNSYFVRDAFLGFTARIERHRGRWLYPTLAESPVHPQLYGFRAFEGTAPDELLARAQGYRVRELEKRHGRPGFSLRYPVHYVEAIARLCREHGAQLHFLYLPWYGEPWGALEAGDVYREHGEILFPPRELLEDRSCWADPTHLNPRGAELIAPWLAAEIASWEPG